MHRSTASTRRCSPSTIRSRRSAPKRQRSRRGRPSRGGGGGGRRRRIPDEAAPCAPHEQGVGLGGDGGCRGGRGGRRRARAGGGGGAAAAATSADPRPAGADTRARRASDGGFAADGRRRRGGCNADGKRTADGVGSTPSARRRRPQVCSAVERAAGLHRVGSSERRRRRQRGGGGAAGCDDVFGRHVLPRAADGVLQREQGLPGERRTLHAAAQRLDRDPPPRRKRSAPRRALRQARTERGPAV